MKTLATLQWLGKEKKRRCSTATCLEGHLRRCGEEMKKMQAMEGASLKAGGGESLLPEPH